MLRTTVQVQIRSTDEQVLHVELGPAPTNGCIRQDGDVFHYEIPAEESVYLSSSGRSGFAQPPASCPFRLPPDTNCTIAGSVEVPTDSGDVRLWLIEYGGGQRLAHQVVTLRPGPFRALWRTNTRCETWCLALRFTGRGRLRLAQLTVAPESAGHLLLPTMSPAQLWLNTSPPATADMWFTAAHGSDSAAGDTDTKGSAARTPSLQPRLNKSAIEAVIRARADHHLAQTHLLVDCYRIRRRLAVPLPITGIYPLDMQVRSIEGYPWSVWMTWALEERINSLGWAAEWFEDEAARAVVRRDLSNLAEWPAYRQRPDLDLTMSHAARIMWTAVNRWCWLGPELDGKIRDAARRLVDDGLLLCERQFGACGHKDDILQHARPGRVLHNTPLVGALATALAMSLIEHPQAASLHQRVFCLVEALLELRNRGYSEGVTYDGYVLDFIICWLETLTPSLKIAILDHPQVHRILEESYMLGAPGNAMQVAELGDVEPEHMPFHLSAQARLGTMQTHAARSWFLKQCDPQWMRADALGLLHGVADALQGEAPNAGAMDAHCAVVLRSGWAEDDLAVAVASSNSPMGHIHCDNGSMVIGHGGRWLVTDAGYQQYMKTSERTFTLGVSAHNAPVINGEAQTRKDRRPLCLKPLRAATFGTTLDITGSYSAGLKLTSVVRSVWLHNRRLVVVADQIVGPEVRTIQYHWHGHADAAWWVQDGWAQLHAAGTTLWITSPQVHLTGAHLGRLSGSRGQVTLATPADVAAPVIWWVFAAEAARPNTEMHQDGLSILVNSDTFGFGSAVGHGETPA